MFSKTSLIAATAALLTANAAMADDTHLTTEQLRWVWGGVDVFHNTMQCPAYAQEFAYLPRPASFNYKGEEIPFLKAVGGNELLVVYGHDAIGRNRVVVNFPKWTAGDTSEVKCHIGVATASGS